MTSKSSKISIIDYGVGNLFSITNAVKSMEKRTQIIEDPSQIMDSAALIIPGVGSFKGGMAGLKLRNLVEPILKFAKAKKPILGICLGAQLLMDKGYEFGMCQGIGLFKGNVVKFTRLDNGVTIPHISWSRIFPYNNSDWKKSILATTPSGSDFYFIHSYVIETENRNDILAYSEYGGKTFASIIKSDNIYGCQFHPEKSSTRGLNLLKEFLTLARKL